MGKQQHNTEADSLAQNLSQGLEGAKKNLASQASHIVEAGKKLFSDAEHVADKAKDTLEVRAGQALNFAEREAIPKARDFAQSAQKLGSEAAADISYGANDLWQTAKNAIAQRSAPVTQTHSTTSSTYGGGAHVTEQAADHAQADFGIGGLLKGAMNFIGKEAREATGFAEQQGQTLQNNESVTQLSQNVKNGWQGAQSIASEVFDSAKKVLASGARSVTNAVSSSGRKPQYSTATYNQQIVDKRP